MSWLDRVQRALKSIGLEVHRSSPHRSVEQRRIRALVTQKIDAVLDVGANVGQYGSMLRDSGYSKRILSFEPLSTAYAELSRRASLDPAWDCMRLALGDADRETKIHIAANAVSSSLLDIQERHLALAPAARYTDVETVEERRLDTVAEELLDPAARLMLKLDVQGYELRVLAGARSLLERVELVEIEMLLDDLYAGQPSFRQLIDELGDSGFSPVSFEPGFTDPKTGYVAWVDGLFVRAR